jgi:hypothetical protein
MRKLILLLALLINVAHAQVALPAFQGVHQAFVASGGATYHADAQTVINSIEGTGVSLNSTQKGGIDRFIRDLHGESNVSYTTYDVWSIITALYGYVGGTAAAHAINWKSPGTYDLTFYGSWVHSATGAKPDGSTAYADTHLNENTVLTLNDEHISYYGRTDQLSNNVAIGVAGAGTETNMFLYFNGSTYLRVQHGAGATIGGISDTKGLFIANRPSSTELRNSKNGTIYVQSDASSGAKSNLNFYIGALNNGGSAAFFSSIETALNSFGGSFSDSQQLAFYNAVQALETTLGRQV